MQYVKRRFFAMRNGVIADTLRRGGSKFRIIFGLNLPQIIDIAREIGPDARLAAMLWDNSSTRESRLLAPMLMTPTDFNLTQAMELCHDITDIEEADIFCHRFMRRHPEAAAIAELLSREQEPMMRYVGLRLMFNIVSKCPTEAKEMALRLSDSTPGFVHSLAVRLLDEAEFLIEQ
ncbi:MAG: DNA alkylation repair protein [Muribaculaceae bacterium]|nr:DNA alkylation repair protein [Muribaculaceae bacterium]